MLTEFLNKLRQKEALPEPKVGSLLTHLQIPLPELPEYTRPRIGRFRMSSSVQKHQLEHPMIPHVRWTFSGTVPGQNYDLVITAENPHLITEPSKPVVHAVLDVSQGDENIRWAISSNPRAMPVQTRHPSGDRLRLTREQVLLMRRVLRDLISSERVLPIRSFFDSTSSRRYRDQDEQFQQMGRQQVLAWLSSIH